MLTQPRLGSGCVQLSDVAYHIMYMRWHVSLRSGVLLTLDLCQENIGSGVEVGRACKWRYTGATPMVG